MIRFVDKLTKEQLTTFFNFFDDIKEVRRSHIKDMLDIYFNDQNGKEQFFSISDNSICVPNFEKTSEDWKIYMRSLFGKKYTDIYSETPVINEFVPLLTSKDIRRLLQISLLDDIIDICELEAFREGTRRFKVVYSWPFGLLFNKEYVIGPHYDYCTGFPKNFSEKDFMSFMVKEFGLSFITYYTSIEKKKASIKIDEFTSKCNKTIKNKIDFMTSIWEKN